MLYTTTKRLISSALHALRGSRAVRPSLSIQKQQCTKNGAAMPWNYCPHEAVKVTGDRRLCQAESHWRGVSGPKGKYSDAFVSKKISGKRPLMNAPNMNHRDRRTIRPWSYNKTHSQFREDTFQGEKGTVPSVRKCWIALKVRGLAGTLDRRAHDKRQNDSVCEPNGCFSSPNAQNVLINKTGIGQEAFFFVTDQ